MNKGRVTIPTDAGVVDETIDIMKRWGADALRDCDGTNFPEELKETGAKVYATYYTTRKDNEWAKQNPDEVQQCYIMTSRYTAESSTLCISLLKGISNELLKVNFTDSPKRWWEVIDRTTGKVIDTTLWSFSEDEVSITITMAEPFHEYTVSFLAYLIWDPVHMYNATVNGWTDFEHQITFDVRLPKTREYSKLRLRKFLEENSHVDVVRFTTFFHQFTLIFDELKREKYVDWFGYSASVSPFILEQFEKEVGYPFRAEYIIDEGYYNNQYRVPSKEYKDFMKFQQREVAKLAGEFVKIVHEYGKEAMMFLGDHWIGTEPYMDDFASIGLDAVVGSVGNASTLRLISDIKGVKYTEGRFLPYFFPDTFHEGGNPVDEAIENWLTARRALLRNPVDRIGYGGYLKLALDFPDFINYVENVCNEFRELYDNLAGAVPINRKRVAVLNCWGKMRSWGCHMVHHALYQKQNYAYAGVIECLAGLPFDVSFISFDDILKDSNLLENLDVIINVGDADTAHTGGNYWKSPEVSATIRRFVSNGGGFIGIGEPSGVQWQGKYLQLSSMLGVEKETGFTLGYDKYNWDEKKHFITENAGEINLGHSARNIYALEGADVLKQVEKEVQIAVNNFKAGRTAYFCGLPYNLENCRMLYRTIMWVCHSEDELKSSYSDNSAIDVHEYEGGRYCVANLTTLEQSANVLSPSGISENIKLAAGELRWFGCDK